MHEDLIAELRRGSFNHEHDAAMHAAADALEAMQADVQLALTMLRTGMPEYDAGDVIEVLASASSRTK